MGVTPVPGTLGKDAKIIGLVCFPHLMSHAYWLAIPPMYLALIQAFELAGDRAWTQIALVTTVFATATFVVQTPVGFVVDRVGARFVLVGGLALEAAAIGLIGVATSYWHLLVLAALAGIGHTVFHPADYAILSSRVSRDRMGRAFSIHSATGYVGFVVAPVFMTGVAELWHWRASFLLIGSVGLLAALLLLVQGGLLRDGDGEPPASAGGEPEPPASTAGGLGLLLSVPVMMCFLYFVLHQMGSGGIRTFLVAALGDLHGTPEIVAATALTAFTAGSVLGILSGGFVADRFGPRVATALATLVPACAIIWLLGWTDVGGLALAPLLALAGFLIGLLIPSRDLLLRAVTPRGSMGKVMGFASTGSNLGGALIPLALGFAMDAFGGSWVFWISGLFVAAACLTFVAARGRYGG